MMKVLVLTGGIASGKSTVLNILMELGKGALVCFDCDREVAALYASGSITSLLEREFGAECLTSDRLVDRGWLRRLVFEDSSARVRLESLIHPVLQQECLARMEAMRQNKSVKGFVIDVPLFFEGGADYGQDAVCVVGVSPETQRMRLTRRNGFGDELIQLILSAQLPLSAKLERADMVLWNEGPEPVLRSQTECLYNYFFMNEEQQELVPAPEAAMELPGHAESGEQLSTSSCGEAAESADSKPEQIEVTEPLPAISVNELRLYPMMELQKIAEDASLRNVGGLTKSQLVFELGRWYLRDGRDLVVEGIMEQAKDNYAMLRDPVKSFRTSPDDIYVPGDLIRRYGLKVGNLVQVRLRRLRPHDKYLSACEVLNVEGIPADEYRTVKDFEKLTPLFPRERIILENKDIASPAMRVLDLVTPFGKGQRGLIVAPPRGGKTILLKTIARSIHANYSDIELIVLLLDERPEEVTDFEETVGVSVFASTFDEPSRRHAQVSDLVIERAKRLVEQGKDVVILLDSLTRLSRGYNANQSGGRIMSGGLGSNALEKPRKFFGAARNVEEGGSLTILATCLIDTESRMDEVIFEEFKGTGNMEIKLDRELSERRIYPAISLSQSGTRNDDRLYNEQEFQKILQVRRQLAALPGWEGLELLLKNITKTQNNAELEIMGLR